MCQLTLSDKEISMNAYDKGLADGREYASREDVIPYSDPLNDYQYGWNAALAEKRYTRQEVMDLFNKGVNTALGLIDGYEDAGTILANDVVNMAVNAISYLLDHPGADADEIIAAQYTDVSLTTDDFGLEGLDDPLPEKGSPEWNAAVVSKVRGWFG
jgi:hypothetical protein